jgi:hypothetical protein
MEMTYGTFEQCRNRVLGATHGLTAEQVEEVTKIHFEGECVWHAVSMALNRFDRCQCVPCVNKRKELK